MEYSRMHWLTLIAIGLFAVGIFWMLIASPGYSYYYPGNLLGIILLGLNATLLIAFIISMIASILGFSQILKEKLSTRLSVISLIIGLIVLANSIAIYAFTLASRL